ncbi:unnamed protein product [Spirodela intermedia]|uniref:Uncharacterized protein n=1 Tax=Spirodela intermedia TaxID=51605 RepID=A0A7I8K4N2_SPIIN|nr:unnamed protein product [Spirodela intermedia]
MEQIRQENQQITLRLEKDRERKIRIKRRKIRSTTHSHFITEDELRKTVPLPKALESKLKKIISIPLTDAIKHIPTYTKILKELCTPHRSPQKISLFEEAKLPTLVKLQLVDRSIKTPRGLLEDAIIHVKRCKFLVDFFILDIFVLDDLTRAPIILGCPFLTTVKVNIDCKNRIINMKYEGQNISLNIFRSSRFLK